jgi:hypothetical protein
MPEGLLGKTRLIAPFAIAAWVMVGILFVESLASTRLGLLGSVEQGGEILPPVEAIAVERVSHGAQFPGAVPVSEGVRRHAELFRGTFDGQILVKSLLHGCGTQ